MDESSLRFVEAPFQLAVLRLLHLEPLEGAARHVRRGGIFRHDSLIAARQSFCPCLEPIGGEPASWEDHGMVVAQPLQYAASFPEWLGAKVAAVDFKDVKRDVDRRRRGLILGPTP